MRVLPKPDISNIRAPWWFFPVAVVVVFSVLYGAAKLLQLLEIKPGG